jgi:hypothetical protein
LWHHVVERGTITKITRELFYDSNNRLHQLFNSDDAQFGCYVSKDSLGCRLRLDIKPIMMMESATGQNKSAVQFAFNYHYEVVNRLDAVSEITQKLGQWENAKTDSSQIFQTTLRDR